jgi:hypothetical protein
MDEVRRANVISHGAISSYVAGDGRELRRIFQSSRPPSQKRGILVALRGSRTVYSGR